MQIHTQSAAEPSTGQISLLANGSLLSTWNLQLGEWFKEQGEVVVEFGGRRRRIRTKTGLDGALNCGFELVDRESVTECCCLHVSGSSPQLEYTMLGTKWQWGEEAIATFDSGE